MIVIVINYLCSFISKNDIKLLDFSLSNYIINMELPFDTPTELNDENEVFIFEDDNEFKDPTYEPNNDKFVLKGKEFKNLTKMAKKLGAESLDYSKRKNDKYVVKLPNGKKIHFGSSNYPDFLIHKDEDRKENYLKRAKKIKNKQGELTYNNPESSNFWSVNLLWPEK